MRSKLDSFLVDGRQAQLAGDRVFAFCGLGNPEQFFELLRRNGLHLLGKRRFPDHHPYTDRDMRKIWDEATASGASRMVTTAKDLVRVPRQWQAGIAVAKLRVEGVEDLLGLALSLRVNGRH
jgi:tetraacyldisaccharide 4'-kinase